MASMTMTSVTSQPPTISTNMAGTVENHEQPSHTLREEVMGHTAEKVHQATNLLDKLLARSATLHQRLDNLTTPVSPSFGSRKVQPDPGVRPGDILDSCISRAQELNDKVDILSTKIKTPVMTMAAADNRPPTAKQVHVVQQFKGNTAVSSPTGCTSPKEVQREHGPMDLSPYCKAHMITQVVNHPEVVKNPATLPSCA